MRIKEDLTNKQFNFWTVLKFDEEKSQDKKKHYWVCSCKCGTIRSVSEESLLKETSKSCGCLRKIQPHQVFNFLETIERDYEKEEKSSNNNAIWKCKCLKCGNTVSVRSSDLKSGHTKSCGCLNKELISKRSTKDLTGQKFGKLSVIEKAYSDKNGHVKWRCKCECGNETIVYGDNLVREHTLSCGCLFGKSKNEIKIANFLNENKYNYCQQYRFQDLKDKRQLKFDFAIFDNEEHLICLIEFQGEQHFQVIPGWGDTEKKFQDRIKKDNMKKEYCKKNNIPLIELTIFNEKELKSILDNLLIK